MRVVRGTRSKARACDVFTNSWIELPWGDRNAETLVASWGTGRAVAHRAVESSHWAAAVSRGLRRRLSSKLEVCLLLWPCLFG